MPLRARSVCSGRLFAVTAHVASQSRLKSWRRQLVVQCALRLLCFLWFEGKSLYMSVSRELRAGCSQVDVAQCHTETELFEF